MQPENKPGAKLEQSWVENELDSMNSGSQMREGNVRTFKPISQDPNSSLLGKTAATYPHIPQPILVRDEKRNIRI